MNIAFAGFRHTHIFSLYNSALKNSMINITGCFEEDQKAKDAAIQSNNVQFNYDSYEQILNDEKVDAIAIGDYYGKRGKMIIDALNHGKHIICDKPICTDLDELYKIKELSEKYNSKISCMLDLRYMPQISKIKELIAKDELGTIHIAAFTGQHCLNFGVRPDWYFQDNKHGGTINDIAIHGIDLLRFITGKNLTKINCAKTWNAFADKAPDFNDSAQFMVEMENMSVIADVSYAAPAFKGTLPTYWDFKLWGTKGMLSFNLADSSIHIFKDEEYIISCPKSELAYLQDFINEVNGLDTNMNTSDVLLSQEQVLKIQKYADEMRYEK